MAFDGIITAAMAAEIRETIVQGKIDRVHQPEPEELVLGIHAKNGNRRLYCTVNNAGACIRFLDQAPANPPQPLSFCMLLRKHLIGGRIVSVEQKDCERIIEIAMETRNELGFTVSKKLIFELMGKYNNIILVNLENGKIIDAIRRVPIDTGRSRAILPGALYEYPTAQDKVPRCDAGRPRSGGRDLEIHPFKDRRHLPCYCETAASGKRPARFSGPDRGGDRGIRFCPPGLSRRPEYAQGIPHHPAHGVRGELPRPDV